MPIRLMIVTYASNCYRVAVRRERHCVDRVTMPLERLPVRPGRRIPEPDGLIP
jgi:hypothetical protein